MATKRPREGSSTSSSSNANKLKSTESSSITILSDEIQAVTDDLEIEQTKKAQFIKNKLDKMTDEERIRFEAFHQSHLSRSHVKEIMAKALKGRDKEILSDEILISVCGLAKLFVGDMISRAVEIMEIEEKVEREWRNISNVNNNSSSNSAGSSTGSNSTTTTATIITKTGLQPSHIQDAYRQMKRDGKIGYPEERSYLFNFSEYNQINHNDLSFAED